MPSWIWSADVLGFCNAGAFELGSAPTTRDAQAVADELYSNFVSQDVDKVELVYTKFVSLISSNQTIQTLLPLTPQVSCLDVVISVYVFIFLCMLSIISFPTMDSYC